MKKRAFAILLTCVLAGMPTVQTFAAEAATQENVFEEITMESYVPLFREGNLQATGIGENEEILRGDTFTWETSLRKRVQDTINGQTNVISVSDLKIPWGNIDDALLIVREVLNNNPHLFYLSGAISSGGVNGNVSSFRIALVEKYAVAGNPGEVNWTLVKQDTQKYEARMEEGMSHLAIGMTKLEQLLAFHDFLVRECEYDSQKLSNGKYSAESYTAFGALVNNTAVCQGYSEAFADFCNRIGVQNVIVSSSAMNHAWNMVYLDGYWYHIDVTWDDPVGTDNIGFVRHTMFLYSDAEFMNSKDHYGWTSAVKATKSSAYSNYIFRQVEMADLYYSNNRWYYSELYKGNLYSNRTEGNSIKKEIADTTINAMHGEHGVLYIGKKDGIYVSDVANPSLMTPFLLLKNTNYPNSTLKDFTVRNCSLVIDVLNSSTGTTNRITKTLNVNNAQKHDHSKNLTAVAAKNATCTVDGNKAYYSCICGKWFSDAAATKEITDKSGVVIKASHSYATTWSKDANNHWYQCSKCGAKKSTAAHVSSGAATETKAETCTVCGYVIKNALGHVHTKHLTKVNAVAATCIAAGNKAYYTCSCGKWFSDANATKEITDKTSVTIAKLGHSYASTWSKDATNHWYQCTRCTSKKSAAAHVYTDNKDTTCNTCGYVRSINTVKVEKIFKDVIAGEWYVPYVQFAYDQGYMKGKSTDTFGPKQSITRAEFVQVLYNKEKTPAVTYEACFTDVLKGQWYTNAVIWAKKNNIVAGKGEKFDVFGQITREEMATILKKYAEYKKYTITVSGNLSSYSDVNRISSWAVTNIKWAVGNGIMSGKGQKIDPTGVATRAECATMLKNFCDKFGL